MEISPIAGLRILPVAKVRPIQPELTASFDIEAAVRPDDDTYSSSRREAAGAEEPDEESENLEELPDDNPASQTVAARSKKNSMSPISFFA